MEKKYLQPNLEIEIIETYDVCLASGLFGIQLEADEAQGEWIW